MVSEAEMTGPDPADEPRCEIHQIPLIKGECPACKAEDQADDPPVWIDENNQRQET